MPLVTIRVAAGRSTDEVRDLVRRVSEAVSESLGVPIERVGVHVVDLAPERIARGGRLAADL